MQVAFLPIMFVSFLIYAFIYVALLLTFLFSTFTPPLVPSSFCISSAYVLFLFLNPHSIHVFFYWFLSPTFNSLHSPFRFISSESARVLPVPVGSETYWFSRHRRTPFIHEYLHLPLLRFSWRMRSKGRTADANAIPEVIIKRERFIYSSQNLLNLFCPLLYCPCHTNLTNSLFNQFALMMYYSFWFMLRQLAYLYWHRI